MLFEEVFKAEDGVEQLIDNGDEVAGGSAVRAVEEFCCILVKSSFHEGFEAGLEGVDARYEGGNGRWGRARCRCTCR